MVNESRNVIDFGADVSAFPTGTWGNFDGEVKVIEFREGLYGTQLFVGVRPLQYEWESRGLEYDPDGNYIGGYESFMSLGSGDFNIEDWNPDNTGGYELVGNAQPNRRSRGLRFILELRDNAKVNMSGPNIRPFIGARCHFEIKEETSTNPQTKESVTKNIIHAISPLVGAEGSTVSESLVEEAEQFILWLVTKEKNDGNLSVRTRAISQEAMKHEADYGADVIQYATRPNTIEDMIRKGLLARVDERTVKLAE